MEGDEAGRRQTPVLSGQRGQVGQDCLGVRGIFRAVAPALPFFQQSAQTRDLGGQLMGEVSPQEIEADSALTFQISGSDDSLPQAHPHRGSGTSVRRAESGGQQVTARRWRPAQASAGMCEEAGLFGIRNQRPESERRRSERGRFRAPIAYAGSRTTGTLLV